MPLNYFEYGRYNAFGVDKKSNDFLLDCHAVVTQRLAMTHRVDFLFQAA
ncbi:MAG: hypothetical protein IJV35_02920 [Neisseriaceae bacterium]|nr:hypothetical protein [Neisseriaceae bacterium]